MRDFFYVRYSCMWTLIKGFSIQLLNPVAVSVHLSSLQAGSRNLLVTGQCCSVSQTWCDTVSVFLVSHVFHPYMTRYFIDAATLHQLIFTFSRLILYNLRLLSTLRDIFNTCTQCFNNDLNCSTIYPYSSTFSTFQQ